MKYQVLFSLKNNEKVFTNVVCYSRDWRFKGQLTVSCFSEIILKTWTVIWSVLIDVCFQRVSVLI